ncbi:hypothetical protein MtrunA17_Chr1g0168351 [Medicago truncatula]|uniref:Transmembrane protein n=1 Tax=Medicago truncatula TaxID=3880 RepID=A0A396JK93_MEDTR|nr:hypothetical protein MtrunA17_Chr1g0168351 [Medicago truncatula]
MGLHLWVHFFVSLVFPSAGFASISFSYEIVFVITLDLSSTKQIGIYLPILCRKMTKSIYFLHFIISWICYIFIW